jgi:hypothetical protein
MLTDDALLYVFDFYLAQAFEVETWHTLVHVCRRWRNLVFASPGRLNLRIACTNKTQVREKLEIWPPLPIVIACSSLTSHWQAGLDNIIAALEHHDRVCQIKLLDFYGLEYIDMITSLEKPFPILTDLDLKTIAFIWPFDPDPSKFLGGGSTHLRSLTLNSIWEIPDLLKLLLSTPNLVILRLFNSGSFLPDEMVPILSALTRLEQLELQVRRHNLENRRLPLTRTTLPSLTLLRVDGDTEYVEDFMARIDAPLLDHLFILLSFSDNWDIVLNTPQLLQFISRILKLQTPVEAHIGPIQAFIGLGGKVEMNFFFSERISFRRLMVKIFCPAPERQFPCLAQFCSSAPFLLHPLDDLYIGDGLFSQQRRSENTRWLELLRPFSAVKNLYLTKEFTLHIVHALQELVGERVMEVLPTLENVFIEEFEPSGPVHEVIKEFVAARQLVGHPIIISPLDIEEIQARRR